jgi:hypothetical protein
MKINKINKIINVVVISVILILCVLVNLNYNNQFISDVRSFENRSPVTFPNYNAESETLSYLQTFPSEYENYYDDNFVLRNSLIRLYNFNKLQVFQESPSTNVIRGNNGWFFYKFSNYESYYCSNNNSEVFERLYIEILRRKNIVESTGSEFYFLLAPNKDTVYRDQLPENIKKNKCENSFSKQFLEYIKNKESLNLIDPREALIKEKDKNNPIYYKTDSHWNQLGAYIGYKELMTEIIKDSPSIKEISEGSLSYSLKEKSTGDLSNFMGLGDYYYEPQNSNPYFDKLNNFELEVTKDFKYNPGYYSYKDLNKDKINNISNFKTKKENNILNSKKVLFYRDSFSWSLAPFISNTFEEVNYISPEKKSIFDENKLNSFNPDIFIFQVIERDLLTLIN